MAIYIGSSKPVFSPDALASADTTVARSRIMLSQGHMALVEKANP